MKPDAAGFYLKLVKPRKSTGDEESHKPSQGAAAATAAGAGAGAAAGSPYEAEAEQALLHNLTLPWLWNVMAISVCKGAMVVPPAYRDLLGTFAEGGGRLCLDEMQAAAAAAAPSRRKKEAASGFGTPLSAAAAAHKLESQLNQTTRAAAGAGKAAVAEVGAEGGDLPTWEEGGLVEEKEAMMVLLQTARAARHGFDQVSLGDTSCSSSLHNPFEVWLHSWHISCKRSSAGSGKAKWCRSVLIESLSRSMIS
jgi:hypothetical protein